MKALLSVMLGGALFFSAAASGPVIAAAQWQAGNSDSTGDQDNVAIAANRNGHVAIVWEDDRDTATPGDNAHSDIWVRLFKDGTSVYEKKLSAGGTAGVNWRHLQPDVGLDDNGNAVIVWADDPDGNGFYNIPIRVLGPTGTQLYSATANTSADGQQIDPSVGVDPDGSAGAISYTVAWTDQQGTAATTVKAAAFKNATRTYEKQIHATGGTHKRPDVAVNAASEATIVWDEDGDANASFNVGLIKLNAAGTVTLTQRAANVGTGGQQQNPSVAANFNGDFAVAWESDATAMWRGFTRTGTPLHGDIALTTTAGATNPSIGLDDQGNVTAVWTQSGADTWTHGFGPDGSDTARLAAQQLSQVPAGLQTGIAVAVSPWGEVCAAYTDDNDGNGFDQIIIGFGLANTNW
ncbi:hypothetical protein Rhe02_22510 [Rhizocola hellebori]|uniref:Uncharacterized protein n=1 Tax=Rhizocola hellebori TaxID=1392758 RepID=A0A8J3Q5D8_9ACTN|nr:hypothetical protein [Rhizocola hellebori]GIH04184.1 hypothetical protein Rhe02_22510 [Rhizocola hellebori]